LPPWKDLPNLSRTQSNHGIDRSQRIDQIVPQIARFVEAGEPGERRDENDENDEVQSGATDP
jgi:hypothetical protein